MLFAHNHLGKLSSSFICSNSSSIIELIFSAGWRVAEFHDGIYIEGMGGTTYSGASWTQNAGLQQSGGWDFHSYGDVRNDIRFWVHISDQPSTCWTQ